MAAAAVVGRNGEIRHIRGSLACTRGRGERGEDGGDGSIHGEARGCLNRRREMEVRELGFRPFG
jgi:hypothetical protein